MRVLFVIPGTGAGSSMIFARRLLGRVKDEVGVAEAFFVSSRTSPLIVYREWQRLRRRIREFQPDIVHAQYGTVTGLLTVISSSRPSVVTFRGSDLNPCSRQRIRAKVGHLFSFITAILADGIVCVSEELRDRLKWCRAKDRIRILPSGVDTTRFRPTDHREARQRLGWPRDERIVLFNGSDPVVKRLDLARSAVEEARELLPHKLRFEVLAGDTDPDLVPLMMNAADCLLLTSDHEGSPTVVQEAIACGLPIVSVDVGDVRQNTAGITPSYVVSRTPQALAEALTSVLATPQRSNGPEVSQRFSLDYIAGALVRFYDNIVLKHTVAA